MRDWPVVGAALIEVAMAVAVGGMLVAAVRRVRAGSVRPPACRGCGRVVSRAYPRCRRCDAPVGE